MYKKNMLGTISGFCLCALFLALPYVCVGTKLVPVLHAQLLWLIV